MHLTANLTQPRESRIRIDPHKKSLMFIKFKQRETYSHLLKEPRLHPSSSLLGKLKDMKETSCHLNSMRLALQNEVTLTKDHGTWIWLN